MDSLIFSVRVPDEEREEMLRDEFPILKDIPLYAGRDYRGSEYLNFILYPKGCHMRLYLHGRVVSVIQRKRGAGYRFEYWERNFFDDGILRLISRSVQLGCDIYDEQGNNASALFREKLV